MEVFPRRFQIFLSATLLVVSGLGCNAKESVVQPGGVQVLDDHLELSLVAESPAIMTPIGIAVDDSNHLYVLESHTHSPEDSYEGPTTDRIKLLKDTDLDDQMDEVTVFAEGFEDGMNLQFGPEGSLYVVTAKSVWRLHDEDADGVNDRRERIVWLEQPAQVYDHAALLGITISEDGWIYLSRGNTGSMPGN